MYEALTPASSSGLSSLTAVLSKAPQGNVRGVIGSKKPPCILEPYFSPLGMVLSTPASSKAPFPLCHCLVGRCLVTTTIRTMMHSKNNSN